MALHPSMLPQCIAETEVDQPVVKTCPKCGAEFTLDDFLNDPDIEPIGMQFFGAAERDNYFFFAHVCAECGTTFLLPVAELMPLVNEPVPTLSRTGQHDCGGHCLRIEDLSHCSAPCRYAPFRRLLLRLREQHAARRRDEEAGGA